MIDKITCLKCGHQFELEEALYKESVESWNRANPNFIIRYYEKLKREIE